MGPAQCIAAKKKKPSVTAISCYECVLSRLYSSLIFDWEDLRPFVGASPPHRRGEGRSSWWALVYGLYMRVWELPGLGRVSAVIAQGPKIVWHCGVRTES